MGREVAEKTQLASTAHWQNANLGCRRAAGVSQWAHAF
jgi:hypothetical protein